MDTGDKIKMLRKARGYTLEELGKKVGVGKSTVKKWEDGYIKNMGKNNIEQLSQIFHVPTSYLIDSDDSHIGNGIHKIPVEVLSDEYKVLKAYSEAAEPIKEVVWKLLDLDMDTMKAILEEYNKVSLEKK